MKLPNKEIQKKAIKKTVDGIIDILLRMYEKDETGKTFEHFCQWITTLEAEEFYELTIDANRQKGKKELTISN